MNMLKSLRGLQFRALSSFFLVFALFALAAGQVYADKVINLTTHQQYSGTDALQYAVNDANTGDVLLIKGTVIGNTTITGSGSLASLTLRGAEFDAVLDGDNSGRVLTISGPIEVLIENLTIQNGYTSGDGGGISSSSKLTIVDSRIIYNTSTDGDGGGIYFGGTSQDLEIEDTEIEHNSASNNGGGVYFDGVELYIDKSKVRYNLADVGDKSVVRKQPDQGRGGGIYIRASDDSAIISRTEISHNEAADFGGGLFNTNGSITRLNNVEVTANLAPEGAGIYNEGSSSLTINYSFVGSNTATGNGGGINNDGSSTQLELNHSTVLHNAASNGGGIYNSGLFSSTDSEVKHNTPNDYAD